MSCLAFLCVQAAVDERPLETETDALGKRAQPSPALGSD
jgi:hypothetical protein